MRGDTYARDMAGDKSCATSPKSKTIGNVSSSTSVIVELHSIRQNQLLPGGVVEYIEIGGSKSGHLCSDS
jgi:hypothetical protein